MEDLKTQLLKSLKIYFHSKRQQISINKILGEITEQQAEDKAFDLDTNYQDIIHKL